MENQYAITKDKKMSITEIAALLRIETHVLRYWEDEFGMKIERSETGRRMYTEEDIQMFRRIIECKKQGMKLREMKELLKKTDCESTKKSEMQVEETGIEMIDTDKTDRTLRMGNAISEEQKLYSTKEYLFKTKKKGATSGKNKVNTAQKGMEEGDENTVEALGREVVLSAKRKEGMNKYLIKPGNITVMPANNQEVLTSETEQKYHRMQELLIQVLSKSMENHIVSLKEQLSDEVKETIQKEMDYQFRTFEEQQEEKNKILFQEQKKWHEKEEEHFKKLDELLRSRLKKNRV